MRWQAIYIYIYIYIYIHIYIDDISSQTNSTANLNKLFGHKSSNLLSKFINVNKKFVNSRLILSLVVK